MLCFKLCALIVYRKLIQPVAVIRNDVSIILIMTTMLCVFKDERIVKYYKSCN